MHGEVVDLASTCPPSRALQKGVNAIEMSVLHRFRRDMLRNSYLLHAMGRNVGHPGAILSLYEISGERRHVITFPVIESYSPCSTLPMCVSFFIILSFGSRSKMSKILRDPGSVIIDPK